MPIKPIVLVQGGNSDSAEPWQLPTIRRFRALESTIRSFDPRTMAEAGIATLTGE